MGAGLTRFQMRPGAARLYALRVAGLLAAAGIAAGAALWLWLALAPRPPLLEGVPFSTLVLDRHGEPLRLGLAADGRYRLRIRLKDVAPDAVKAVLLYEDRYFFSHPGVNPVSLVRGGLISLLGNRRVGGSTLTMQVVRLRQGLFTADAGGKLVQILRALQLEYHYSKEEILEAYFNLAPYGGNVEGLEAAARLYFHKPCLSLSTTESLALAVTPQHPSRRRPGSGPDFDEARARLTSLWKGETGKAKALPPLRVFSAADLPFAAPHVTEELIGRAGTMVAAGTTGTAGGVIRTAIEPAAQQAIERFIRQFAQRGRLYGLNNAAALLVHWPSMEIRALVGSAAFENREIQGQVDGTRARRSPGSTLKPFVYALALDQGLIHPMSLLADSPRSFGGYDPENFDKTFRGPLPAHEALLASRNIPAIALAARLRSPGLYGFLQRSGVDMPFPEDHYGLSLVLGGAETSMRDLARLYAMLANQGVLRDLTLDVAAPAAAPRPLLSPEAAFMVLSMLENEEAVVSSGRGDLPLRYKTGTSNGFRDAWAVGVFGPYVLTVWVGNFDNRANPLLVGGQAAAPLFRNIAAALAREEALDDLIPAQAERLNLTRINVCTATGDTDTSLCPDTTPTWFWPGVSPVRSSGVFRTILLDKETGLRACAPLPGRTEEVVWEFWPSDLRRLFLRAGIVKPAPPPFDLAGPTCSGGTVTEGLRPEEGSAVLPAPSGGRGPEILTPKDGVTYQVRLSDQGRGSIPLSATADADVDTVFWFAGKRFLGQSAPGESLTWTPQAGSFELRVVDSLGRAATRLVRVEVLP